MVFRKPSAGTSSPERSGALTRNFSEIVPVAEIGGSWQVSFDPQWGGPAQPVTFAKGQPAALVNCYWAMSFNTDDETPTMIQPTGESGNGATGDLATTCLTIPGLN